MCAVEQNLRANYRGTLRLRSNLVRCFSIVNRICIELGPHHLHALRRSVLLYCFSFLLRSRCCDQRNGCEKRNCNSSLHSCWTRITSELCQYENFTMRSYLLIFSAPIVLLAA